MGTQKHALHKGILRERLCSLLGKKLDWTLDSVFEEDNLYFFNRKPLPHQDPESNSMVLHKLNVTSQHM
jgi:hypothetical protein